MDRWEMKPGPGGGDGSIDPFTKILYLNATYLLPKHHFFLSTAPLSNIQNCLKIIKMNSFKNYLPLFGIAFLLIAVKGEIEIGIRITPQGVKYAITVYCWDGGKLVGTGVSHDSTCWIKPYKTKEGTRKRIHCANNHYRIYVQKITDDGPPPGVSREFWLMAP
jgi:hypothetical protein